jgi:hopanoid biosynthesis associated RND transporter like protein HpnN
MQIDTMLRSSIVRIVAVCARHPWSVVALALVLAILTGLYAATHFKIKTDVDALISPDLPWAQRAQAYAKGFPQSPILIVVDAPTPELADQASAKLEAALNAHSDQFPVVTEIDNGPFFARNGMLFLPLGDVERLTEAFDRAAPLVGTLAADPSLRGVLDALSLALEGVARGELRLDALLAPMISAADTLQAVIDGRPASFSWQVLAAGKPAAPEDLRRFIQVEPRVDFGALEPGRVATDAIARIASELALGTEFQARVRQTGRIPMEDDEFGMIKQNAGLQLALSLGAVLTILWFALRSLRLIFAVSVCLFVGLAISAAAGLFVVGTLNLISLAFFVLFIGLGVDFAIQFSIRYRAERHECPKLPDALQSSALKAGAPLTLAAVATAVGFSSFLPTDYRGLSELGQIAGIGMIIAFFTSITLLPALLAILNPPGEPRPMGFIALAPVDRFLDRHRREILWGTLLVVGLASPLLLFLRFDFALSHLRSPKFESVATYLELARDPRSGTNAIELVAADVVAADATAQRISALAQVSRATTLRNFIPQDQDAKLKFIGDAAAKIGPSLNPKEVEPAPTDQENVDALAATADDLSKAAEDEQQPGQGAAAAKRLAALLRQLVAADQALRERAQAAFVAPLRFSLDRLRSALQPDRISLETIPPTLARQWVAQDGQARIEILPNGDPNNTEVLRGFVNAVLAAEPDAIGPAVQLFEAGETVVRAFVEAGIFALGAIAVLLLIALRRIVDVMLTLVPLLIAGIVTLELCVVLDLPLNFANIIALPLLLGVGVAFKIYYIMAWRAGKTGLLQSSLTRAVIFSALTTATAFGGLWLSSHPGTASMGKLMALSLVCTMAAAVLFQPVLMGPPRQKAATLPSPASEGG